MMAEFVHDTLVDLRATRYKLLQTVDRLDRMIAVLELREERERARKSDGTIDLTEPRQDEPRPGELRGGLLVGERAWTRGSPEEGT